MTTPTPGKKGPGGGGIDTEMREFMFTMEASAKKILRDHNKKRQLEAARENAATQKRRPLDDSDGGGGGGEGGGLLRDATASRGSLRGATSSAGGGVFAGTMGGGATRGGFLPRADAPSAASHLFGTAGGSASKATLPGRGAASLGVMPFSLEGTVSLEATAMSRAASAVTGLPPLGGSSGGGGRSRSAASLVAGGGLGETAPAAMLSTLGGGSRRRGAAAEAALSGSPLGAPLSRASRRHARTAAGAPGGSGGGGGGGTAREVPPGHDAAAHAAGAADHALQRRLCKACWAQPTKMAGTEHAMSAVPMELTRQLELQGPTNWASVDLRSKYRDEETRTAAWSACLTALEQARQLEEIEGIVVPVVTVDRMPFHTSLFRQVNAENAASVARARRRNEARAFCLDVRTLWLSGDVPQEAPLRWRGGAGGGGGQEGSAALAIRRSLKGRRDVAALQSGYHQIQSVALPRALADMVHTKPHVPAAAAAAAAEGGAGGGGGVGGTARTEGGGGGGGTARASSVRAMELRRSGLGSSVRSMRDRGEGSIDSAADTEGAPPPRASGPPPVTLAIPWYRLVARVDGRHAFVRVFRNVELSSPPGREGGGGGDAAAAAHGGGASAFTVVGVVIEARLLETREVFAVRVPVAALLGALRASEMRGGGGGARRGLAGSVARTGSVMSDSGASSATGASAPPLHDLASDAAVAAALEGGALSYCGGGTSGAPLSLVEVSSAVPGAPSRGVTSHLLSLLRLVVVAPCQPLPLRGARARDAVTAREGPMDPTRPDFLTAAKAAPARSSRALALTVPRGAAPGGAPMLLNDEDARAVHWLQAPSDAGPLDVLRRELARRTGPLRGAGALPLPPGGEADAIVARAASIALGGGPDGSPPADADAAAWPLALRLSGWGAHAGAVPGASIVGRYVLAAARFLRDASMSNSEGVLVMLTQALDEPATAPPQVVSDGAAVVPEERPEVTFGDAVTSAMGVGVLAAVESLLDSRGAPTCVAASECAVAEADAPRRVAGHRRAGPDADPATGFRLVAVVTAPPQLPDVDPRDYGVREDAAVPNAATAWPARYTWHSDEAIARGYSHGVRSFFYVIQRTLHSGMNVPNTYTVRLSHERVLRLDVSSLREFVAEAEARDASRAALVEKARLSERAAAAAAARHAREAARADLAEQWRQKAMRRAARLRGKSSALGLTHGEWEAKRRRAGARVIARYGAWERWAVLAAESGNASDGDDVAEEVYDEVFYYCVETGESCWDPPKSWPERTDFVNPFLDEGLEVHRALMDLDADKLTPREGGGAAAAAEVEEEADDDAAVEAAARAALSAADAAAEEAAARALVVERDAYLLGVFARAVRRWAVWVAARGSLVPSEVERAAVRTRAAARAIRAAEVIERARRDAVAAAAAVAAGEVPPPPRPPSREAPFQPDDWEVDAGTQEVEEPEISAVTCGVAPEGGSRTDFLSVFAFLDSDEDGTISLRDWGAATGVPLGRASLELMAMRSEEKRAGTCAFVEYVWPIVAASLARTCPPRLRPLIHALWPAFPLDPGLVVVVDAVPAALGGVDIAVGRGGGGAPPSLGPAAVPQAYSSAAMVMAADDAAHAIGDAPGGGGGDAAAARRRARAAASGGGGGAGGDEDPYGATAALFEAVVGPSVRAALFARMKSAEYLTGAMAEAAKTALLTRGEFFSWLAGADDVFGLSPEMPGMPVVGWGALAQQQRIAADIAQWNRLLDTTTGQSFLRNDLSGATVWEKTPTHVAADRALRVAIVNRVDAELRLELTAQLADVRASRAAALEASRASAAKRAADAAAWKASSQAGAAPTPAAKAAAAGGGAGEGKGTEDAPSGVSVSGGGGGGGIGPGGVLDPSVFLNDEAFVAALATKLGIARPDEKATTAAAVERARKRDERRAATRAAAAEAAGIAALLDPSGASTEGGGGGARVPRLAIPGVRAVEAGEVQPAVVATGALDVGDGGGGGRVIGADGIGAVRGGGVAEGRRNAAVEKAGNMPGIGWRMLRPPKKPQKLGVRASQSQTLGPMAGQGNTMNKAAIVGILDSGSVNYEPWLPPIAMLTELITDITKDTEELRRGVRGGGVDAEKAAADAELRAIGLNPDEEAKSRDEKVAEARYKAFLACKNNRFAELEELLVDGLIEVDAKDEAGNTLLLVAAQQGLKRIAKLLLRKGANINAQNLKGNSVLHYCKEYGFTELFDYFKEKGASDALTNADGLTCYEGLSIDNVEAI